MPKRKNKNSDLQGLSQLLTDGSIGIIDLVEDLHKRIINPPFLPSTRVQSKLTNVIGHTYNGVRWGTRLLGNGIHKILSQLETVIDNSKTTNEREGLRSALNGIIGDYLEETDNSLAIKMQFRLDGQKIGLKRKINNKTRPNINGNILLMIHGSSMNDLQWTRNDHNHGIALATELNKIPIYLNYNSGRHISTNGKNLSELLEKLLVKWPVPIEEINIIAHSMGGLVARSAVHYGQESNQSWTKHLKKMIFLGTPHHGAPLEKAGNYLNVILENIPYAKPFARLGKIRSAGVTDLRYGNLVDEDWKDIDRFKIVGDNRQLIQLPKKVDCYAIAGIIGKQPKSVSNLLGDNLVTVKSALGQHKKSSKDLKFEKQNTWIAEETNHLDLLSSEVVFLKIKDWLST